MSSALGIVINVVSYPFTLALGWFLKRLWTSWKLRGDRKLWRPFLGGGKLAVILTNKPVPSTPKVSVTEVQAFSDLRSILNSLGKEVELQIGTTANLEALRGRRLICLGGPKQNPTTKTILDGLDNLPVKYDDYLNGFKTLDGHEFIEVLTEDEKATKTDYGLILKLTKLDKDANDSCPVLIVFGLRGAGTQDAVRAILTNEPLRYFMAERRDGNYYALLKFNKGNASNPCTIESSGPF